MQEEEERKWERVKEKKREREREREREEIKGAKTQRGDTGRRGKWSKNGRKNEGKGYRGERDVIGNSSNID